MEFLDSLNNFLLYQGQSEGITSRYRNIIALWRQELNDRLRRGQYNESNYSTAFIKSSNSLYTISSDRMPTKRDNSGKGTWINENLTDVFGALQIVENEAFDRVISYTVRQITNVYKNNYGDRMFFYYDWESRVTLVKLYRINQMFALELCPLEHVLPTDLPSLTLLSNGIRLGGNEFEEDNVSEYSENSQF